MLIWDVLLLSAGLILLFVTAVWIASLVKRDAGIMDIFWGIGFILAAAVPFLAADGFPARKLLIFALVMIWGGRLSFYIAWRNHGKPEDQRYRAWRDKAGSPWWWQSYFKVFLLQGIILWIVSLPLMAAQAFPEPAHLTWLDWTGLGLWLLGFSFETIGDWQLYRFKKDSANRGRVLDAGLWAYTRHPNYFGEAVLWWGFFLISLATGQIWTIISPLLMTFLLLRVSGVSMLEPLLTDTKPGYAAYVRRTSAFIPWRKKSGE